MRQVLFLLGFAFLTLAATCEPASLLGPQFSGAKPENLRAQYHQGGCFGRCEVYTLEVYNNGLLVFKGERFTDKPGIWHKNLDRRVVTSFLDSFNQVNYQQYPSVFPSLLPDAPTTTITWYDGQQVAHPLSFKEETAPELRRYADRFQQLASMAGYRQVSESLTPGLPVPTSDQERENIIVHLKEGVDAGAWVGKYGKQGVSLKERITPNNAYYLIAADPNLMRADELLEYLRRDEDVISAQLDGQVSPR